MPVATVNVVDFVTDGPAPADAYVIVERAEPGVSGATIVADSREIVRLPGGVGSFEFDAGAPYRVLLRGVPGIEAPWWFVWAADVTAAELYRLHQIDPATLQPVTAAPTIAAQIAALQAEITALQQGGGGTVSSLGHVGSAVVGTSTIAA